MSIDDSANEPFKASLQDLLECEQLTLDQIYCDETDLCYRMLLAKHWHLNLRGAHQDERNKRSV